MNKLQQLTWSVEDQFDLVRAGLVVRMKVVLAEVLREHNVNSQHHHPL